MDSSLTWSCSVSNALRTQSSNPSLVPSQDAQVIQVLTTAAQRVAQEAQSQVVSARIPSEASDSELQSLAKQQHVLTVTAQAVDKSVSANASNLITQPPSVLAVAAQQVVLQAARSVAADRNAAAVAGTSSGQGQSVTVNEVSVATQSAVAQAVEIAGPLSSEVDVLMTATSLLQQQSRQPPVTMPGVGGGVNGGMGSGMGPGMAVSLDPMRSQTARP